jgi:hypothetical protein
MTELGRYTGIYRDELAGVSDSVRQDLAGLSLVTDVSGKFHRYNIPRWSVSADLAALTTQIMTATPLFLRKGDIVTNLSFMSGATAAGTPTNWWFALYNTAATPALLAQTADQLTAAWAANTVKTLALSAPYTAAADGIYWPSIMVKATTVPTLAGAPAVRTPAAAAVFAADGEQPLAQTSGSALVGTAPATLATPTTVATIPWVAAN